MRSLVILLAVLVACSDDEPPLTDATSLDCPAPGALPFRLASRGFQKPVNQTVVTDNPRKKDQASDTLGKPGTTASTFLADSESPSAMPIGYHGIKARSTANLGFSTTALGSENVSLWFHDDTAGWMQIGRGKTDDVGVYDFPDTGFVAPNGKPVYAMLEADGSCAAHFDYLFPAGSKVVVTDIDGTLTLSDDELLVQVMDEAYRPKMMGAADKLVQAWAMKGYPVVYLTARPHVLRPETRVWLDDLGFPAGPLITNNGGLPAPYKTAWMNRMIQSFGWNVVVAYGNADTDITAYENAGVPKAQTFIVGPLAGARGTTAIANNDFTAHIDAYVKVQPDNR